jgi:hemerythrin-like domain-containing protein
MKATKQLRDEHEGVMLMLQILSEVSRQFHATGRVNEEHFTGILEFLKVFVDQCHHEKEEELLFPALVHSGIPQDGPIAVMLYEHEMGRKYVRVITEAFERHRFKDATAAAAIEQHALDYIELLTDHIDKENNILFAMADDRLSQEKQDELFDGFEKIEASRIGPGKHAEFHALLGMLSGIYLTGK